MRDNSTKNKKSFIVIHNGIVVEVSKEFINLTGYSTYELIGKSNLEISKMLKFNLQKKIQSLNDNFHTYLFTKLLEPREVIVSLERDNNENAIICFFNEKKNSRLDEKFLYVEQLYLENNSGIAIYSGTDLILLKANQKYIDYLNEPFNTKEKCIGKKIDEIVTGFKESNAEKVWADIIKNGKTFYAKEVMYDRYDRGITYWDSSVVPIYEDGKVKYLIENVIEVTERVVNRNIAAQSKIIEEQKNELKTIKEQLEVIIENIYDGICIINKNGEITVINAEIRKNIFNPNKIQFVWEFTKINKIFDMSGNEINLENIPLNRALKGEIVKNEIMVVKQPDKELILRINAAPIYDINGNLIMALACSHDITDLINKEKIIKEKYRQLEILKEEADNANRVKSLFLANMSHEVRTPMNGILATIQLLESTTISIQQRKYIKMLKESSNTLLTIINDILDISKIESGTYKLNNEEFSLKEVVNSIYNNLLMSGNAKGLDVSYYLDPTIDCIVVGDEQRLKQILNNLISNAIKFTEEGYISFRITKISSNNDYVKIKFTIKDTGIGIEESFKEKIFDNFTQCDTSVSKKYMGTGLGLAISKQLATLMNGNISLESTVGEGTTFFFTCELKISNNKRNYIEESNNENNDFEKEVKTNNSVQNKVILCVEDNLINQEVMESIIKRKGYKYIAAYNGNEALSILEDNNVDLILMDVQMIGLNGLETTKIIRNKETDGNHIPIIAMTAYAMLGDKDKCIKAGMDNYISKPFNIEELYNIFEFYLGK